MMICGKCKKEITSPDSFCPHCGSWIAEQGESPVDDIALDVRGEDYWYCPDCGYKNSPDLLRCWQCNTLNPKMPIKDLVESYRKQRRMGMIFSYSISGLLVIIAISIFSFRVLNPANSRINPSPKAETYQSQNSDVFYFYSPDEDVEIPEFESSLYDAYKTEAYSALDVLRSLQAATEVGINYVGYGDRLIDTKIKVERFLRKGFAYEISDCTENIYEALVYYEGAGMFWDWKFSYSKVRKTIYEGGPEYDGVCKLYPELEPNWSGVRERYYFRIDDVVKYSWLKADIAIAEAYKIIDNF